eukprot:Rhum_TRINITY_DN13833_c0_g1::Rhum_TRINITY_DN13833_c0_g1_i1::g.64858::m.64858
MATQRGGTAVLEEVFPAATPCVLLRTAFDEAAFTRFQDSEGRKAIEVLDDWAYKGVEGEGAKHAGHHTWERRARYVIGESLVLRQGESKALVSERAYRSPKKDAAVSWRVHSTVTCEGGPLAQSTRVSIEYSLEQASAAATSAELRCSVSYEYCLDSVSWLIRSTVDGVVESEMKTLPAKQFAFIRSRLAEQGAAAPPPPLLLLPSSPDDDDADDDDATPAAAETPVAQSPRAAHEAGVPQARKSPAPAAVVGRPSAHSSSPVQAEAATRACVAAPPPPPPPAGVSITMPRCSVSPAAASPRDGRRAASPPTSPRRNSAVQRLRMVSQKRIRALLLIVLIVFFWIASAMVGSTPSPAVAAAATLPAQAGGAAV